VHDALSRGGAGAAAGDTGTCCLSLPDGGDDASAAQASGLVTARRSGRVGAAAPGRSHVRECGRASAQATLHARQDRLGHGKGDWT